MSNSITVGMDMGDKSHRICVVDEAGEVVRRDTVGNTAQALRKYFGKLPTCVVAIEAGTHSGWVSQELAEAGHEVLVGNPRKLRAIWDTVEKDDDRDAEMLARIARFDPKLLCPIHHRGQVAREHLAILKARDQLVGVRTQLIGHVRDTVKSAGARIPSCNAEAFHHRARPAIPDGLRDALGQVIQTIEDLTARIRNYDKQIEDMCTEQYPETMNLRGIQGVGPITALAFVLTLEDPHRFARSRSVGPFLGLTRRRDKSGETDKQLRISKAGDEYLRRLLVGCAHYILGPFGPDCLLRRFGLRLARGGGKNAKRRAVIAVARKLAVLLHHLWITAEAYDPFYVEEGASRKAA